MNWQTIFPLVQKDLTLFFRNRFYAFITIMALIAYIGIYYLMPDQVEEVLEIGVYAPASAQDVISQAGDGGFDFRQFTSLDALQQAVIDKTIVSGIAFPENMLREIQAGRKPTVKIFVLSDIDQDTRDAMQILVEAISLSLSGQPLNFAVDEVTLGPDMAGAQIPPRDRALPLFAVVVLMFETLGLASLLAEEVQSGTARALLVTPLSTGQLFVAKGIVSVLLVLTQAAILLAATGAMRQSPMIILVALFLGALLVTGIGFLLGSVGKDMLSVIAWGVMVMLILGIPAFGVVFPGTMTGWAKLIPTYYLADTVHQVVNFGAGWSQVTNHLLFLLAWDVVFLALGAAILKRKFA